MVNVYTQTNIFKTFIELFYAVSYIFIHEQSSMASW